MQPPNPVQSPGTSINAYPRTAAKPVYSRRFLSEATNAYLGSGTDGGLIEASDHEHRLESVPENVYIDSEKRIRCMMCQPEKIELVKKYTGRLWWMLITFVMMIPHAACTPASEESIELRVMSYNIAAGYGNIDGIAEVIAEYRPDVVALQEVDIHWGERSDFQDQVRFLEEKLGMNSFFAEIYNFESEAENVPPRQFGLAILSKSDIIRQENHMLSRMSTQSEEPGLLLMPGFPEITIEKEGIEIHIFNTHLDYRGDPMVRIAQAEETLEIMNAVDGPIILAGDLNARPDAEELSPLFHRLEDVWTQKESGDPGFTFPSDQPDRRIDYILHSGHFQVTDAFTVQTEASDHLPVVADLVLFKIK